MQFSDSFKNQQWDEHPFEVEVRGPKLCTASINNGYAGEVVGSGTPPASAANVGLTLGAVTSLIDRLEQHGFVRCHHDLHDRRKIRNQVSVTRAGKRKEL